ncbi:hypothetical protein CDAR_502541 [Caerostris darwini]|uniref:Uncharacterized protein n=1 Tax=Caerostris darwini TaxID=1538125 RepID=A0AAV4VP08_9ARAC|nr:hypothetical protein CDAR_502451 [Caerostris darwini]GIY72070.1 hypothetical protein CDAR_502541 [Caerostris darwini]
MAISGSSSAKMKATNTGSFGQSGGLPRRSERSFIKTHYIPYRKRIWKCKMRRRGSMNCADNGQEVLKRIKSSEAIRRGSRNCAERADNAQEVLKRIKSSEAMDF